MLRLDLLAEKLVEFLHPSGLVTNKERGWYNHLLTIPTSHLYLTRVTPATRDWAPALAFLALLDTTSARDFIILTRNYSAIRINMLSPSVHWGYIEQHQPTYRRKPVVTKESSFRSILSRATAKHNRKKANIWFDCIIDKVDTQSIIFSFILKIICKEYTDMSELTTKLLQYYIYKH